MLRKEEVADNVWAIYGDTQQEIAKGFVRFQEYYENKDLKGKTDITVNDIEKWWDHESVVQDTKDSYYEYWAGFNVPGKVILRLLISSKFRVGFPLFPWWYPEEDQLVDLLQDLTIEQITAGYFIGLSETSTHVLDHECAHALYSTNPEYKAEQDKNISELPEEVRKQILQDIIDMGYHPDVAEDELQAYLSTYIDSLPGIFETDEYDQYTEPFEQTFEQATCLFR